MIFIFRKYASFDLDNCVWSEWLETECSVTCGIGKKIRRRYVRIPAEAGGTCDDSNEEAIDCDTRIPCIRVGTELM